MEEKERYEGTNLGNVGKMTKRVIFIVPAGKNPYRLAKNFPMPQLGPLYLATIAKQAGFDVSVVNEGIIGRRLLPKEFVFADIICVSCMTPTVDRGKEIAREYKLQNQKGVAIIGGIHASMIPSDVTADFDHVIIGEAESVIVPLLQGKLKDKLIYGQKMQNLDKLPIADLTLVEERKKIKVWPIMTSRGCPFDCIYCSSSKMFGKKYRAQSPERVMQELIQYKKGHILFFDDNFTAIQSRTNKLMDLMIDSGFDREWSCEVRTETTKNEALISKMRSAGCYIIGVGFESINDSTLKYMRKHQTVQDIRRSVRVFHDNGINAYGMFIMGSDNDSKKVFRDTVDFCCDIDIDYTQYSILTPFPGTNLYYNMEKEKRIIHKNWEYYDGLHAVIRPKKMTVEDLQNGLLEAYRTFYSYGNGLKDVLRIIGGALSRTRMPSIFSTAAKLFSRPLLHELGNINIDYLDYLNTATT